MSEESIVCVCGGVNTIPSVKCRGELADINFMGEVKTQDSNVGGYEDENNYIIGKCCEVFGNW